MKNRHIEDMRRKMREFHRHHQWRLNGALYIPHAYSDEDNDKLSWWADVGFILNDRRVIVHWVHPRCAYSDAIEAKALSETPEPNEQVKRAVNGEKTYCRLGRSRKKVAWIAYDSAQDEMSNYIAAVRSRQIELAESGIDADIRPSIRVSWYKWATAVDLVAPIEVRTNQEVKLLAALARRLLKRETSVENEWPSFSYGRADWLSEANARLL